MGCQQVSINAGHTLCKPLALDGLTEPHVSPSNYWLEEAQAGMKIAGRNINNLRYADDITLMAESEEKLKSLLMKVKEDTLHSSADRQGPPIQHKTRCPSVYSYPSP